MTPEQSHTLTTIERIASCFSVAGTLFVFLTFISSPDFRRPINRLVFYASWGNTLCSVATLISESGIKAGEASHLCQFQAFLIQMFVPADAFWNLAMAYNVYLTLFKNYNASQLKALEWRYHVLCYGTPFLTAFVMIFIETESKGRIYGAAVLWCWISRDYDYLRVALCYAPAWVAIVAAFSIYTISGRKIFKKRRELRAFNGRESSDSWENFKTTQIRVTSEANESLLSDRFEELFGGLPTSPEKVSLGTSVSGKPFDQYSVKISTPPKSSRPSLPPSQMLTQSRKNRAVLEANRAAWGYTKVALLFFVSLLVTWVPSSVNRLYALAHSNSSTNIGLAYVAAIVLSLMGFWNSVIYIVTSRAACKSLFISIFMAGKNPHYGSREGVKEILPPGHSRPRDSWNEDLERHATDERRSRSS